MALELEQDDNQVPDPFPYERLDQQNRLVKLHNYWYRVADFIWSCIRNYKVIRGGYNAQSAIYYCKNKPRLGKLLFSNTCILQ